jgi:hypothetical protein
MASACSSSSGPRESTKTDVGCQFIVFFILLISIVRVATLIATTSQSLSSRLMYRTFKLAGSVVVLLRLALAADVYELEAKKLANLMSWKPGDAIAEIGAGEGQMSFWAVILGGMPDIYI